MKAGRPSFAETEARVLTLFGSGRLEEAHAVATEAAAIFPDRTSYTAYWSACIRCALADPDGALHALEEALEDPAVWWSRETLEEDQDLGPLRARPGFERVVEESERRGNEARAAAAVRARVLDPSSVRFDDAVLVALHGRTGNLTDSAEAWGAAAQTGITTVVLQSSQMLGSGMHCWDDLALAARDVAGGLRSALGHEAGPRDVVLAGFSQGGGVATLLALAREPVAARGVVAVAPSFFREGVAPEDLAPFLPGAAQAGVSVWLCLGGDDHRYRARAEDVAEDMAAAGVRCRATVNRGTGHAFPPGFAGMLEEQLAFVLDRA